MQGVKSFDEKPRDFEKLQYENRNYKIGTGECINEVKDRMYLNLMKMLDKYENKKILIVSHKNAITSLLLNFGEVEYNSNFTFKNQVYFKGCIDYLDTFKLTFDGKELKNILFV